MAPRKQKFSLTANFETFWEQMLSLHTCGLSTWHPGWSSHGGSRRLKRRGSGDAGAWRPWRPPGPLAVFRRNPGAPWELRVTHEPAGVCHGGEGSLLG